MVLRRQADPGSELPPRSKHLGCRSFHQQQSRADRTDAGDIGEASAAFIGLVPGHELGVGFGDLRLQLRRKRPQTLVRRRTSHMSSRGLSYTGSVNSVHHAASNGPTWARAPYLRIVGTERDLDPGITADEIRV